MNFKGKLFLKTVAVLTVAIVAATILVTAFATNNSNGDFMQNDYLALSIGTEQDNNCRFILRTNDGDIENEKDDNKNVLYDNFYSSYTTIVVNGITYRYGEGETVKKPYYDRDAEANISVQKFGDVEVTQTLTFSDGMGTGHKDMLLVSYDVKNSGENEALVGIRIMLDSQLGDDDLCYVTADNADIKFESTFTETVPTTWQCVSENGEITTYGKYLTKPDSVIFANWSTLFDSKWDASISTENITDSAVAYEWSKHSVHAGENSEYAVYYGVKNKIVVTEPATTEPATTESVVTEPATTEPATTEPATTESVVTEPATTEPATTEPATTESVVTEPATTEPATTEPATTEPATTESVVTEPATTEPATTESVVTEPAITEPATTESVVTEPATTESATTESVVTEPATTEPTEPQDATSSTSKVNGDKEPTTPVNNSDSGIISTGQGTVIVLATMLTLIALIVLAWFVKEKNNRRQR